MSGPPGRYVFQQREQIPNSFLPLLVWKAGARVSNDSGRDVCRLYERNGWGGTWVYTVFPFWHFHTKGHEVLTCVSGRARVGFGGDAGIIADVAPGDVAVVPAGVGHRLIEATDDFLAAGAYPPSQQGDIVRPGDMNVMEAARRIAALALPETDPITGKADGVVAIWTVDAKSRLSVSRSGS